MDVPYRGMRKVGDEIQGRCVAAIGYGRQAIDLTHKRREQCEQCESARVRRAGGLSNWLWGVDNGNSLQGHEKGEQVSAESAPVRRAGGLLRVPAEGRGASRHCRS